MRMIQKHLFSKIYSTLPKYYTCVLIFQNTPKKKKLGHPCPILTIFKWSQIALLSGKHLPNHIHGALPETNISLCDWGLGVTLLKCSETKNPYHLRARKTSVWVMGNIWPSLLQPSKGIWFLVRWPVSVPSSPSPYPWNTKIEDWVYTKITIKSTKLWKPLRKER